jgi:hypothetical protein
MPPARRRAGGDAVQEGDQVLVLRVRIHRQGNVALPRIRPIRLSGFKPAA